MAHIKLSGIPSDLHQAAISWLVRNLAGSDHTSEVVDEGGARIYGHAPPEPAPSGSSEPPAGP